MSDQIPEPTLEQLAAAAQQDDLAAFQRLVERTRTKVFGLTFRILTDEDDARDAAQESFIRLWENLSQYDPGKPFETWFYRVATNVALDHLRSRKRWWKMFQRNDETAAGIPDERDAGNSFSNAELARLIRALTIELPLKQRMVILLRDFQDLSTQEVAEVTHMSIESVKTNLYYARTHIRRILKKRFDISGEVL